MNRKHLNAEPWRTLVNKKWIKEEGVHKGYLGRITRNLECNIIKVREENIEKDGITNIIKCC